MAVEVTWDNTIVGDRILMKPVTTPGHMDEVTSKYSHGKKALVLHCSQNPEIDWSIGERELPLWHFFHSYGPPKPVTNDRRAMEYGDYSVFSIEREIDGKFQNESFILHHGCRECEANYQRVTTMAGAGYVPHRASQHCRSGKRPHCTCDTCF